jgi:hypothetical protein
MKRKKVIKKRRRSVKSKKIIIEKNPEQVRKDLELFATGVERLKELELELNSLDTRGFAKEVESIRDKLKNVSDIPIIEREMKNLRQKIKGRYHPKKKNSGTYKKIREGIEDIQEDTPRIERQLKQLNEKIEGISKKKPVEIDAGVGMLVDADFSSFLKDVKEKLSGRVKRKEIAAETAIRNEIKEKERLYREKNNQLIREFKARKIKLEKKAKDKYDAKVKSNLHRVVEKKFNSQLDKKLKEEKERLRISYMASMRKHAEEELKARKKRLRRRFEKKLLKQINKIKKEEENRLAEELGTLNTEKENLHSIKRALTRRRISLRNRLKKEFGKKTAAMEKTEKIRMAKELGVLREQRKRLAMMERDLKERDKVNAKKLGERIKAVENMKRHGLAMAKGEVVRNNAKNIRILKKNKKEAERLVIQSKRDAERRIKVAKELVGRKMKAIEDVKESLHNSWKRLLEDKRKERAKVNEILERERRQMKEIDRMVVEERTRVELAKIAKAKEEFIAQKKAEARATTERLSSEFHTKLNKELSSREKVLRAQMRNEFELKMKNKMKEHEEELKKKKMDLELEIQNKMKSVLR